MAVDRQVLGKVKCYRLARAIRRAYAQWYPEFVGDFERAYRRTRPARHGKDFGSIRWYGVTYKFTPSQAAIVRILWRHWRNGSPWVRQETLLRLASSDSDKVAHLFKDHAAWGTAIQFDRGLFALVPPEDESTVATRRFAV